MKLNKRACRHAALVLTHLDALYGSPTSDLSGKAPGECVP